MKSVKPSCVLAVLRGGKKFRPIFSGFFRITLILKQKGFNGCVENPRGMDQLPTSQKRWRPFSIMQIITECY